MQRFSIFLLIVGLISLGPQGKAEVNLVNGAFYTDFTLLSDAMAEAPQIHLLYDHQNKSTGLFGVGWCSNLEHRLAVSAEQVVFSYCGSGKEIVFQRKGNRFTAKGIPGNAKFPRVTFASEGYELYYSPVEHYVFNDKGVLSLFAKDKTTLAVQHSTESLWLVRDQSNKEIFRLELGPDKLVKRVTAGKQAWQFSYEQSFLLDIADAAGVTLAKYDHDPKMRVKRLTSGNAAPALIEYDTGYDLVAKVTSGECTEDFNYRRTGSAAYDVDHETKCGGRSAKESFAVSVKDGRIVHEKIMGTERKVELIENLASGKPVVKRVGGDLFQQFNESGELIAEYKTGQREAYLSDKSGRWTAVERTNADGYGLSSLEYDRLGKLKGITSGGIHVSISRDKRKSLVMSAGSMKVEVRLNQDGQWRLSENSLPHKGRMTLQDARNVLALQNALEIFEKSDSKYRNQ